MAASPARPDAFNFMSRCEPESMFGDDCTSDVLYALPGGAPFCPSFSSGSSCFGVVGAPKEPPSLRHAGRKLRLGCVPASAIAADPQVSPRCGGFLGLFF